MTGAPALAGSAPAPAPSGASRAGAADLHAGPPVRVVHVVWNFDGGGLESLVATLARRLLDTRFRTSVVSLSGRVGRLGAELAPVLEDMRALKPRRVVSMIAPLGLARLLREMRADVVHLHSGVWYKGALAARMAGVRTVVFTEHGREHDDPLSARLSDGIAARMTDVVVPVSPRLAGYLERRLHVPAARLRVIQNAVDTHLFAPAPPPATLRGAMGIPADALVVGAVGRLVAVKGYDDLIDAVALLRGRTDGRPVHLVLCGDGPDATSLAARAAERGIGDAVHFAGWQSPATPYYRLFDVLALSSHSEGLSLSLLEGMACGAAPVVTDVGANREVLGTALAGYVVPPRDVPALADAIGRLLGDDAARARARLAARARVEEAYDLDAMVAAYAAIYARGARGAHRPRG